MTSNNFDALIQVKVEVNKLSKKVDAVLDKHNEVLEMMKRNTINSAISSIEELCFQFKLAVVTDSVNLPLLYTFIRHFDVLINSCDKRQQTPLLTCFAYLYECFRMISPDLYFDKPTTDLNKFILDSHPVFGKIASELFTFNSSECLHKQFVDHWKRIRVNPHKKFYYEYLKKLRTELNKILIDKRTQYQLSFCFVPSNRFNINLDENKVYKLYDYLVANKYIDSSNTTKHSFLTLFNNTPILNQPQSIIWIKKTSRSNKPSNISLRTFFNVLGKAVNEDLLSQEHRLYWESIFCTETKGTLSLEDKGKPLDSILKEAMEAILK